MGITETDNFANFESVQLRFMNNQISKDDLIYLYNPVQTSQTYNSGVYGVPMIKPCIDSARALRKIPKDLEKSGQLIVMPEISCYLNKNTGVNTLEEKESRVSTSGKVISKPGGSSVLIEDPGNVKTHDVKWSSGV